MVAERYLPRPSPLASSVVGVVALNLPRRIIPERGSTRLTAPHALFSQVAGNLTQKLGWPKMVSFGELKRFERVLTSASAMMLQRLAHARQCTRWSNRIGHSVFSILSQLTDSILSYLLSLIPFTLQNYSFDLNFTVLIC